jgi:hypothetical protein
MDRGRSSPPASGSPPARAGWVAPRGCVPMASRTSAGNAWRRNYVMPWLMLLVCCVVSAATALRSRPSPLPCSCEMPSAVSGACAPRRSRPGTTGGVSRLLLHARLRQDLSPLRSRRFRAISTLPRPGRKVCRTLLMRGVPQVGRRAMCSGTREPSRFSRAMDAAAAGSHCAGALRGATAFAAIPRFDHGNRQHGLRVERLGGGGTADAPAVLAARMFCDAQLGAGGTRGKSWRTRCAK